MTMVSKNPSWCPYLEWCRVLNYFIVISSTVVVYDWILTFPQEFQLIWRRRWSHITVLYICVRYLGILYSVVYLLANPMPSPITDVGTIMSFMEIWTPVVVNAMLGVIIITRIHAMYQRSKPMLIFVVVVFLASTIASGVMTIMANIGTSGEEFVLSGIHTCVDVNSGNQDNVYLNDEIFIPTLAWEILAFFLAAWIVLKRFRELQQSPTGSTIGDSFAVLIKSHVLYFVGFVVMSCIDLGLLSRKITESASVESGVYYGALQISQFIQMFVLGPRLILSVRESHVKVVVDEGTAVTTIVFEARGHVSTGGGV
ncbi:uncharacterized protein EDB91DRAFT_1144466 [Suillus paluster]|uniref:uncharacterized protein n=1 Tax=Suillus paluster TaxID=48578 RepID=UPI001B868827|nr:uncharacterized protein EDB91DRAFT_1144466 [Suillus paluster]KAG1735640.1 hypothetical protein EDB91DRAFT_1144466 [Suillus paluster]